MQASVHDTNVDQAFRVLKKKLKRYAVPVNWRAKMPNVKGCCKHQVF